MRLELAGGQSATLRERLTYGQARDLRVAFLKANDDPTLAADVPLALMRAYVSSWNVLDFEGRAVSLDMPELAPDDVLIEISAAAIDLWNGTSKELPKAGNGISAISLPEPVSVDSIPTSPMPSSSSTTPDGPGTT